MIARVESNFEPGDWAAALRESFQKPADLLDSLGLTPAQVGLSLEAAGQFPFRVPRAYARLMRPGDPSDPLLRQVLPIGSELESPPGFVTDPVGDLPAQRTPGLLQKYHGRALLIVTGACGIHCRYCFRRAYPYGEALGRERLQTALNTLAASPDISEIILSGGDPLTLPDSRLRELAQGLADIPQLRRLRVHTRLPVTLPARLTAALRDWLTGTRLEPVLVLHANHPRELTPELQPGLRQLRNAGVTLLNQSVLLRGVNDDAATLAGLSTELHRLGVLPYYLHLLDRVVGSAHFEVPAATAQALMKQLRALLPGYLVPRLVCETAGEPNKTPL